MVRLRHYWGLLFLSGIAFSASFLALAEHDGTAPDLSGTVWQWQQTLINDDDKFVPDSPVDYTVQFMADGTVAVQSDCSEAIRRWIVIRRAVDCGKAFGDDAIRPRYPSVPGPRKEIG